MPVIVLGAGAIGSLYGATLSRVEQVTFVTRPAHAQAIARDGLHVVGLEDFVCRAAASVRIERVEPDTLILLTTKVCDSEAAVEPIVPLVRKDTVILCVQNGLCSEDVIKRLVGERSVVLRAITHCGAIFRTPGVVDWRVRGYTAIEPHPAAEPIAALLARAGLDARVTPRFKEEMWRKLVFNCVVNPLTAMAGMEVGWIADERLSRLKQLVIDECLAVARADGVAFDGDFLHIVNDEYRGNHNTSSMLQDLQRGRRTEIEFLNGGVARLGERYGIDCPTNRALAAIIRQLETRA